MAATTRDSFVPCPSSDLQLLITTGLESGERAVGITPMVISVSRPFITAPPARNMHQVHKGIPAIRHNLMVPSSKINQPARSSLQCGGPNSARLNHERTVPI
jgi:hypothetical protein